MTLDEDKLGHAQASSPIMSLRDANIVSITVFLIYLFHSLMRGARNRTRNLEKNTYIH